MPDKGEAGACVCFRLVLLSILHSFEQGAGICSSCRSLARVCMDAPGWWLVCLMSTRSPVHIKHDFCRELLLWHAPSSERCFMLDLATTGRLQICASL